MLGFGGEGSDGNILLDSNTSALEGACTQLGKAAVMSKIMFLTDKSTSCLLPPALPEGLVKQFP